VLDLLLLDVDNPRSVLFQVQGLVDYSGRLSQQFGACGGEDLSRCAMKLRELNLAEELAAGESKDLKALLLGLRSASSAFSDQVSQRFFSHVAEQNIGGE